MANLIAIISKPIFEKAQGTAGLGDTLGLDRYLSTHRSLATLAEGGALFLVTVRPPDEALWLVGILESPELRADGWYSSPNTTPLTDITRLREEIQFANGKGMKAKKGALAMSLQTPRALADADVERLRSAARGKASPSKPVKAVPAPPLPAPTPAGGAKARSQAKPAPTAGLGDLIAACERGDGNAALLAALEAWRAARSPALAELIDALSERISAPPVAGEVEFSKLAAGKNPLVLGRLLPAVTGLSVSFLPTAADMLGAFPDDPRIAKAVATWAQDPPTTSSSTYPFWTKSIAAMVKIGDSRVLPLLAARLKRPQEKSQFWPKFYAALEKAVAKIGALEPPATDEKTLARLTKLVPKLARAAAPTAAATVEEVPRLKGPPLTQAAQHLAAGRIVPALTAMLEVWRRTRAPDLADRIDRASRLLPSWDRPIAAEKESAHDAWMAAVAADPVGTMPQLMLNVNVPGAAQAERHLVELAGLPEDPRIPLRLAEVACLYGISPERRQYWKSLWELIARHRDVRTCAPLRRQFRDFTGTYYDHHRQGKRIVGEFVLNPDQPKLSEEETAQLDPIDAALAKVEGAREQTELDLLRAIAESPEDNTRRLVYADWLSERGHPRGELIVLSCKETLAPAQKKRLEALRKLPYVLGQLQDLMVTTLDRGLPRELKVDYWPGPLTWRALVGHPLLIPITSIHLSSSQNQPLAEDLAALITHPFCAHLTEVEGFPEEAQLLAVAVQVQGKFEVQGMKLVRT